MSRESANDRLGAMALEVIDRLVGVRGQDDIGEGDEWTDERLATCENDYAYDLAVEVRKLRTKGIAWWRIAHELGLPGSGPSVAQGRSGAALARRIWRAAWGNTYETNGAVRESRDERKRLDLSAKATPYFSDDDHENDIVKKLAGARVEWVARLDDQIGGIVTSKQDLLVHEDPKLIRVKLGPKGRYVEFYEQLDPEMLKVDPRQAIAKSGPLRSLYLDRIVKVGT